MRIRDGFNGVLQPARYPTRMPDGRMGETDRSGAPLDVTGLMR